MFSSQGSIMSYPSLVFLIGLTVCYAQTDTNICNKHQNLDRIRDVTGCTKYFECVNGEPIQRICEMDKQFDHELRICSSEPIDCFKCPSDTFFVDLPVDHECSQFIRCINGKPKHHICESDLLFDPIRRQCNKKKKVVCPCPAIDIPGIPLFVRDWNDCARYSVCANGSVATTDTCFNQMYFDLSKKQCASKTRNSRYFDNNEENLSACETASTNIVFEEIPDVCNYSSLFE